MKMSDEEDGLITDLVKDLEIAKSIVYQVFDDAAERTAVLPIVVEELLATPYLDDRGTPVAEPKEEPFVTKGKYLVFRLPDSWQRPLSQVLGDLG